MTDNEWEWILSIFLALAVILLFIILICIYKKVKKHSLKFEKLNLLNNTYTFFLDCTAFDIGFKCKSKKEFDQFDPVCFFKAKILECREYYSDLITKMDYNISSWPGYCEEFKFLLTQKNQKEDIKCRIPYFIFVILEKRLLKRHKRNPPRNFTICANVSYISPQGRNQYEKCFKFNYTRIKELYLDAVNDFNSKQARYYQIKLERSKMNDYIRYNVLKRDNYKCRICGLSTKDGVILHADHIIPVSKGGKPEMSNLQTLCDRCNIGKSDKPM